MSDVGVDLLMESLSVIMIGALTSIDVSILVDVNANVFAGVIAVEFVIPAPLQGSNC